jgi:selenocysteine lyase/cysteine desulfurase
MPNQKRRAFIKNSLLGAVGTGVGINLMASTTDNANLPRIDFEDINWEDLKKHFILSEKRTYLNTAGLGPSTKSTIQSVHDWTMRMEKESETGHGWIKSSRQTLADFFHVLPEEMSFTRNTTEGVNIIARGLEFKKGDEIILTNHEHVGGIAPWILLREEIGLEIKVVELDLNGEDNLRRIKEAISNRTKLLFVSHVTCTNGMQLPVKELAEFCRSKGILSFIDGAQAVGNIAVNLSDIDPDFYAASGHKWLLGPKSTGFLYINQKSFSKVKPHFVGAYSVENLDFKSLSVDYVQQGSREEYGTRSTPVTKGFENAIDFIDRLGIERVQKRGIDLSNYLRKRLKEIPKVQLLSPENPNYQSAILTFKIDGIDYKDVQSKLRKEFKCRTRAIYEADLMGIRVSCGIHLTYKDLDHLIDSIRSISS